MTIRWFSGKKIEGLAADTKPTTNVENGMEFKEIDTGIEYTLISGVWVQDPGGSGGGGGGSGTGAAKGGTSTQSGNASTKTFTIAHGLGTTPTGGYALASSVDALGEYQTDIDSTNITITYQIAPASGTNNLSWIWSVNTDISGGGSGIGGNGGTATFSGNASTKIFNIPHLLGGIPTGVSVEPSSTDAFGDYQIDKDITNITITYQSAPPTGTDNLVFEWVAIIGTINNVAVAKGTAIKNGDSSTTVFNIPHGMASTPSSAWVTLSSVDAIGVHRVDIDDTNIIITYQVPPPTGTGNLEYFWGALNPTGGIVGTGEVNTASNVGAGTGTIYKQKNVFNLELKSLVQGTDIALTNNASDVTIAAGTNVLNTTNTKTVTNKTIDEASNTVTMRQPYSYLIYPHGATEFRVKRGSDNAIVYTSSNGGTANAKGALDYCTTALGNTSPGGVIWLTAGYFPVTSTFTINGANHRYIKIRGVGDGSNYGPLSEIRATGNFAAITLDGQTGSLLGVGLEGLYLSHDENTFGTGLIRIIDTVIESQFKDLSFSDMAGKVGDCFKFEILNTTSTATQYSNKIINCNCRGFDNFINVNNQAPNSTFNSFMSDLDVHNCMVWNTKRVLNIGGVSGAYILNWNFDRVNYQHDATNSIAANEGVFNYDSVVSCWQHKHTNCMVWDITAPGINYANVGTSVELALNECNPTFMIGGSGAYLNKVKVTEYYLGSFGPMNVGWIIPSTTVTPGGEGILSSPTFGGTLSITQDSTGPYGSFASGTTQGTNSGPRRGPATFRMEHRPYLEIYGGPSNTTISRCYHGLGTQVVLTDTDNIIGTTDSGIFAGWRPADTNIQIFHHDGDGSNMTVIDTGLAKVTSMWKCAFIMDSTGFQWKVATVNGSKVSARVTAQIPAASTNMAFSAQAQNTTTTSINQQLRYAKLILRSI